MEFKILKTLTDSICSGSSVSNSSLSMFNNVLPIPLTRISSAYILRPDRMNPNSFWYLQHISHLNNYNEKLITILLLLHNRIQTL